jgi:arylsulfatase A-like enzyme
MKERGLQAQRYPQWNHAEPAGHWIFSTDNLGFTHDIPLELTSEHWVTDNSISFIKDQLKNRPGEPFFLHASYFAPHHPYGVVREFDTYDPEKIPLPPSWSPEASEAFSKKEFQQIKAKYFGFITQLDHEIGRLLDFVDSDPALAGNTVILFMSDHGDRMGEHGMLFKGDEGAMLDGSAAVPGTYSCLLPPGIQSKCYFSTSIIPINKQLNRTQCELNTTP